MGIAHIQGEGEHELSSFFRYDKIEGLYSSCISLPQGFPHLVGTLSPLEKEGHGAPFPEGFSSFLLTFSKGSFFSLINFFFLNHTR